MQSSASIEVKAPSLPHSDAVSIKTHGNENIGINVEGSAEQGFYVKGVEPDSVAEASGKIETGDQLTGITIDMNTLSLDEAQSLLKVLSPYPVKISVKKASHDESLNASAAGEIGLNEQLSMIDSGIEIKGPKIDQTKFEIRGRKAKGGAGIDVALPDEEIKIKRFEHKSDAKRLDIDVQSPTGSITFPGTIKEDSVHDPKTKGYLIKLPKFGDKGKVKADVDIEAQQSDMTFRTSMQGEGVHLKSPKSGGININLPSFGLSGHNVTTEASIDNINKSATAALESRAETKIDVKAPKGKEGFHIAMPKFGIKSKTPKADIDANSQDRDIKLEASMPETNVNGKGPSSGGININLPSFGITRKVAEVEGGVEAEINKRKTDINIDTGITEADVNVKPPEAKGGFHIGLPSLPKVSLKGKGLKGDAGVDVDLPEADLNVSAEAPDIDIKAPKGSGGFHIGMPKFGIKGKGVKGDVDLNLPEADLNVDASLPDADVNLKEPKGSGGFNINLPTLPSFGISGKGPKVEGGIDADVKLPKGDIDVKGELPDVDIDVKAPKGKGGFHMPKFGFKGKVPKGDIDVNLPEADMNVDAGLPDADVNLKGPKGSGGFDINLPSFGISGKGPKVEGELDADVKLPKGDIDVKAELPDVDIDVKAPKGKGGFHMPKFGFKGKGVKGDVDVNFPEVDTDLNAEFPDVEANVNAPKGGFHMNLPSIPKVNIKGRGVSHGNVDVDVPSGDLVSGNADVDVHVPKGFPKLHIDSRGNVDKSLGGAADIDAGVSLPKSDSDNLILSSKSKSKGFHIGIPKFSGKGKGVKSSGFSRAKSEGVDTNIAGKDYSIELPKFNLATSGLEARADISGSAAHGGASVSGSSPVHISGRYQTGFPKITSKSQSFEPNLNVNMETSGAKVGSLPREIDSASRKGKFRVKARPRSMEIGASASESDHDVAGDDTGTTKKRKRRGFIQRIKDFFSTDSKSPSLEFEHGSAPEHPDYHEKPNVSAVSITHDDSGLSIKPKSSITEVTGDVPEASVSLSPPALSGGLQADLPSVSYSFSSSKTVFESKGPSHHQVTETKEIRIEKGNISSEFKSASETSHVQVEKKIHQ